MAKEIIMPKFGFTQEESEILEWLKNEGENVEKGDPIAVVSTDKISMEVEAPETGILAGIQYPIGSVVPVTEIIAYIVKPGEKVPTSTKIVKAKAGEKPEKAVSPKILKISPVAARMIQENLLDSSVISATGAGGQISREDVERYLSSNAKGSGKINATPSARRIADESGIDLKPLQGSGPGGRIQVDDVKPAVAFTGGFESSSPKIEEVREIPLVGMRRAIAENMQRSMREAPHMTLQINVQMDTAESQRKDANSRISENGEKISTTAVIVKAAALAIRKNMIINSQFTPEKILIKENINIGVAVAIEDGLIVPVVANADAKHIDQISTEVNDLAMRARFSKLKTRDLLDGTFTISNLGMLGVDSFTAIINPPQSAILAVGAIRKQIAPDDSEVPILRIAKMMSLTLSADHRVMDGAQAAYFLADIKNLLENPGQLFL